MAQVITLDEYQARCGDTANYPEAGTGLDDAVTYTILGLVGEAGEVADKYKKNLRGDYDNDPDFTVQKVIAAELGDVLWYAARLATEIGLDLSEVAQGNLDKLASRKERGVIKGSGDLR